MFDIESELQMNIGLKLKVIQSTEGLSTIAISNLVYICGVNTTDSAFSAGSYFFSFDLTRCRSSPVSILVNSLFNHYKPTLVNFSQMLILTIGGLETSKCEQYDIVTKKWRVLPDLPEDRLGASSYVEGNSEFVYIFGGLSKVQIKKDKNALSILRLQVNYSSSWEELNFRNTNGFFNKSFSAIFATKESLYIFGGYSAIDEEPTNEVIELDLQNKKVASKLKLERPMGFKICQESISNSQSQFFLINDDKRVIKVDVNGFKIIEKSLGQRQP